MLTLLSSKIHLRKIQANLQNIKIVPLEKNPNNAWIRDFGPVYLVNKKGQKKLVNFYYSESVMFSIIKLLKIKIFQLFSVRLAVPAALEKSTEKEP